MNKLKKEALKVIASNLPAEEITGLKEMFEAMDKDGRWDTHTRAIAPWLCGRIRAL